MRQDVDFSKRQKSGGIFFQVGLIAVMVIVLFALEFRFKKESQNYKEDGVVVIGSEEPFNINPINIIRTESNESKVVAKVELPRPADPVELEVKKNEEEIEEPSAEIDSESSEETPIKTAAIANTNTSISSSSSEANTNGYNVAMVEVLPSFPACKGLPRNQQMQCFEEQLRKAVSKNLTYPEDDYASSRQGRSYVEFTIDENGEFSDVKIVETNAATATKEMNKAAEKAVKKLKKINPAKQGNTPVKVKYTLPISFRIQ